MSLPPNIRVNVRAPFPTQVIGSSFITVVKANGKWTIAPNYEALSDAPALNANQVVVIFDPTAGSSGAYFLVGIEQLVAAGIGAYREVTVAGDVTVQSTDVNILMNKTVGASTNINLPASENRGGLPITVKDLKGDAETNNITFVPASGETIDGFSASDAAANGVALIQVNYGSKTLYPLTSGGWYLLG